MNYAVRELQKRDVDNRMFATLSNLRSCGDLTAEAARRILARIQENPLHRIFIAAHADAGVIGIATLLVEPKFIRNGGLVGHIEDVATRKEYERNGIASAIIRELLSVAKREGCYKVILDCSPDNVPFYRKLGFREHAVEMRLDL